MVTIVDDEKFKPLASGLSAVAQRALAARYVEHVLTLNNDERITRVVQVAAQPDVSAAERATALHAARSSRRARTCESIEVAEDTTGMERQYRYRILSDFLDSL